MPMPISTSSLPSRLVSRGANSRRRFLDGVFLDGGADWIDPSEDLGGVDDMIGTKD